MTKTAASINSTEVLAIILATKKGKVIKNLEKQLVLIAKQEESKDNLVSRTINVHPQYNDSKQVSEFTAQFRLGGALLNIGVDMNRDVVAEYIGSYAKKLGKESGISRKDYLYLRRLGRKIQDEGNYYK